MEQAQLLTLIEKCRQGDQAAQEKLVVETQNKVYYHCKKFLKNEEDAQDATQDVLITMLTSLDNLRQPAAFWGWLNGITANRCKHLLTQGTREWQIPEDEEGNSMLDSIETLDDQTIPDQALDTAETQRLVLEIIDGLPAEQRMTVVFFYYDEMSVKDIAAAMEVSEGTVKSRLNYARKTIKAEVEKLEKKDGTKLYSISILPFLAFFLRRGAQAQALSPATAMAITQGTLAASGGTAAAAGATSAGAASSMTVPGSAAAAAEAKATGAASTKIIAAVLAGTLAVGGIAGGVYVATHREPDPEPAVSTVSPGSASEPGSEEPAPAPEEPAFQEIPEVCARVYGPLVAGRTGEDTTRYQLAYIDGDDIPELLVSSWFDSFGDEKDISIYSITPEETLWDVAGGEQTLRQGVRNYIVYYPKTGVVADEGVSFATSYAVYYRMGPGGLEELDSSQVKAETHGNITVFGTPDAPEGLEGEKTTPDISMTAQEMLELLGYQPGEPGQTSSLGFDFSPYVGTYTADPRWEEKYDCDALDLSLNSDGSLSGGGATYSWSNGAVSDIPTVTAPIELRIGKEGYSVEGSYTFILRQVPIEMEGQSGFAEEYYVFFPRLSDFPGPCIYYVNATGGVWDMLYVKID